MRNMSFALTRQQIIDETKSVTRRDGWWDLKPGELLNAVEKSQGLKRGEKVVVLKQIRIISTRPVNLNKMTKQECILEGFPEMSDDQFIEMFCSTHKNCAPNKVVNRIQFVYVSNEDKKLF